ncbi:hypothetical protein SODALDRAFT_143799 [Sodiomyces alkalinus F11]|uniref:Uncharacterized protein n=1 Tax=Sodiomyces alkalinus (strain CBS 110278 / VKM F-3762 / F11) TaxID=1314773 RepID=A0A3N2PZT4_SODAK|nr:hypothetical protein SODALDRAFT_143799 [Sodiomyces alkalinus F11]ROT40024.1 hypothetical protein SODALDRAFT_143799 [Sodiomyces alkalinus F11]
MVIMYVVRRLGTLEAYFSKVLIIIPLINQLIRFLSKRAHPGPLRKPPGEMDYLFGGRTVEISSLTNSKPFPRSTPAILGSLLADRFFFSLDVFFRPTRQTLTSVEMHPLPGMRGVDFGYVHPRKHQLFLSDLKLRSFSSDGATCRRQCVAICFLSTSETQPVSAS